MNSISSIGASSYGAVNTASDSQGVQKNNVQVEDVAASESTSGTTSSTEVHISEEGRALSSGSQQGGAGVQGGGQAAGIQQGGSTGGSTAVEDQKERLKKQIEALEERLKEKQLEQARLQQSATTDENGEVDERAQAQIDAVMTEISTISASLSTAQALLLKLERDELSQQG
ncbi:hypothetical protein FMZ60_07890 [Alcaligenaceae bacterium SJ-26]|nr:hypothetical protein FMZ60_07890 [Alcaligenaceae bacterium SJ-26]